MTQRQLPAGALATAQQRERMHIPGHIREIREGQKLDAQAKEGQQGHDVLVTVISGGRSINGYYYAESTLRQIAEMVEGARAYADHAGPDGDPRTPSTRSVRDMVGFYKDARYIPPGEGSQHGRVDATLHILEAASWLWSMICEAVSLGRPDLVGLSIDIFGVWEQADSRGATRNVTRVHSLNSCDVVTRPSAGGSFRRVLNSQASLEPADTDDNDGMDATSDYAFPSKGEAPLMEPLQHPSPSPSLTGAPASSPQAALAAQTTTQETANAEQDHIVEAHQAQQTLIHEALRDIQRERCALLLERRLMESPLPQAVQQQVRAQFAGRIFEERELDDSLGHMRAMLAELHAAGLIRGNGYEKPSVGQVISEAEKIQVAFDRMFDLEIDSARLGAIRGFTSIREAYARVTGDASVAGFSDRSTLGAIQISEHAPLTRITEADTTTASFSYLLGTSMNKRLLKDYQAWPAEWQKFCTIAPIKD
ncbi:MAG TPA: hypothetical protein VKT25_11295, partial [Ktedonobacteraceae bacterium]|nr:hypothetical protein [Ktedonobacteraceae bacterium]